MSLNLQVLMALLCCAAVLTPASTDDTSGASTDTPTLSASETTAAAASSLDCLDSNLANGTARCDDCLQVSSCVGGVVTSTKCGSGKACYQDGEDNAVCVSVGVTECGACKASQLTICDPYDEQKVLGCVPGKTPVIYETCLGDKTCQNGACAEESTTPDISGTPSDACNTATGGDVSTYAVITYKPECTSGLLCSGSEVLNVINCTEGRYFDQTKGTCLNLPVNNCDGRSDGPAPHQTDCTKGVLCKGGAQVSEFDCEEGEEFNVILDSCVKPLSGRDTCAVLNGCTFESTESTTNPETTAKPSASKPTECTSDNLNKRYPVEGDCKSYWSCRKTSSTSYRYVKLACTGSLVFNPVTTYCGQPSSVPGC